MTSAGMEKFRAGMERFKARIWHAANYELQADATRVYRKAISQRHLVPGPCVVCGETPTHGHHEDYAKPLDVTWLCTIHHSWRHTYSESVEHMRANHERSRKGVLS